MLPTGEGKGRQRKGDSHLLYSLNSRMLADVPRIGVASVARVDPLISWNVKHLSTFRRLRAYNEVNRGIEYEILEIRTPTDVCDG